MAARFDLDRPAGDRRGPKAAKKGAKRVPNLTTKSTDVARFDLDRPTWRQGLLWTAMRGGTVCPTGGWAPQRVRKRPPKEAAWSQKALLRGVKKKTHKGNRKEYGFLQVLIWTTQCNILFVITCLFCRMLQSYTKMLYLVHGGRRTARRTADGADGAGRGEAVQGGEGRRRTVAHGGGGRSTADGERRTAHGARGGAR